MIAETGLEGHHGGASLGKTRFFLKELWKNTDRDTINMCFFYRCGFVGCQVNDTKQILYICITSLRCAYFTHVFTNRNIGASEPVDDMV